MTAETSQWSLISATVHELRAPLTVIRGVSDMLSEETFGRLNPHQREQLRQIKRAGARASRLVDGLAHIDSLERSGSGAHRPVQLQTELSRVLDQMAEMAAARDISLEFIARRLPPMKTVAGSVYQLFSHLLSAAIRRAPEGSLVEIKLRRSAGQLLVQVTHQGAEIGALELYKLPERIGHRHQPLRHIGSTSVELYIVQRIASFYGGTVSASHRGAHPVICVRLPLLKQLELF